MSIELVNHPEHYNKPGQKECIEQMEESFGFLPTATFALGSAYKYLYRAGDKTGEPEQRDIDKALWYYNWVRNKCREHDIRISNSVTLFTEVKAKLKEKGVLDD